jgi:hypothetical protein
MRFDHDVRSTKLAAPAKDHRYVIFRLYRDTVFFCAFVFALLAPGTVRYLFGTGARDRWRAVPSAGRPVGQCIDSRSGHKGDASADPDVAVPVPPEKRSWPCSSAESAGPQISPRSLQWGTGFG